MGGEDKVLDMIADKTVSGRIELTFLQAASHKARRELNVRIPAAAGGHILVHLFYLEELGTRNFTAAILQNDGKLIFCSDGVEAIEKACLLFELMPGAQAKP